MGSAADWKAVLESGGLWAVLIAAIDIILHRLFRTSSSLPGRWTFQMLAGYSLRQAFMGLWFGMAITFGGRLFHGPLAAVFAACVAGWLVAVVWFARAVERQKVSR